MSSSINPTAPNIKPIEALETPENIDAGLPLAMSKASKDKYINSSYEGISPLGSRSKEEITEELARKNKFRNELFADYVFTRNKYEDSNFLAKIVFGGLYGIELGIYTARLKIVDNEINALEAELRNLETKKP